MQWHGAAPDHVASRGFQHRQTQIQVHHLERIAVDGLPTHLVGRSCGGQEEVARVDDGRFPFAAQDAFFHVGRAGQYPHDQRFGHRRHQYALRGGPVRENAHVHVPPRMLVVEFECVTREIRAEVFGGAAIS